MGTLPPAISGFSPDKLPFGRMVQLSITSPTIGGAFNEGEDYTGYGIYGPCPIGSLPMFIDTFVQVSDEYAGDNDGYAGSTFTETNQPWQFHPQSPAVQPYLINPNTAPWDGTRRIQYWDQVQYDYTTNNSLTGLSGTGPRLVGDTSEGQIIITAPEDRPVPYVTWLNLSVGINWGGGYPEEPEPGFCFGYYTNESPALMNMAGPSVGIVRHSAPADNVNYRLLACEEVTSFFAAESLMAEEFRTNYGLLATEAQLSALESHYYFAFQNWNMHTYGKKFVSLFAFDVVPPNESYIVHAGWQHPTKNDWVISSFPRDMMFGAFGAGTWTYTSAAPTTYNPDGTRWDAPMNRFGVMTF